jgi:hypothetical protein
VPHEKQASFTFRMKCLYHNMWETIYQDAYTCMMGIKKLRYYLRSSPGWTKEIPQKISFTIRDPEVHSSIPHDWVNGDQWQVHIQARSDLSLYEGNSINKVTRPLTCVMFLISFKFPARSEQVEHCFLAQTLDRPSYQSYCPNISCKMAGLAETWSNIEVRSVIRFLRLKGTSPACRGVRC